MKQEVFVLINSNNEVVRNIHWEGEHLLVAMVDDRLEFLPEQSVDELAMENIKVLTSISKNQVKKSPVSCVGNLKIAYQADQNISFVKSVEFTEEDNKGFFGIMRKTALAHMIVLLILLVTAYFYEPAKEAELRVVTVMRQDRPIRKEKTQTVSVKKKIIRKKPKAIARAKKTKKSVVKPRVTKVAKNSVTKKRGVKSGRSTGASFLGALDGLHAGQKTNSLNMGSVNGQKSKHVSTGSYGGAQNIVAGKALVASTQGSGRSLGRVSAYQTRGKGGQNGYGKVAISGNEGVYSAPLKEEAFVDGGLDRSQIDAVVKRNIGQITYCYEKGLQKDSQLSGRVAVNFIINPMGKVSMSKVQRSSLGSKTVESCILAKLNTWKFPKPYGQVNVKVTYPFSLMRVGMNTVSMRGE